jgi:hypothetical protein
MGGWYVESLLRNRYKIYSNIYGGTTSYGKELYDDDADSLYIEDDCTGSVNGFGFIIDVDNDDYNNLLLVEKKIAELTDKRQISPKERMIIDSIVTGTSLTKLEEALGMSRITIAKIFSRICSRISFLLGYSFTDEGYLDYIAGKYKLNEEQLIKARDYMSSNKKHIG